MTSVEKKILESNTIEGDSPVFEDRISIVVS